MGNTLDLNYQPPIPPQPSRWDHARCLECNAYLTATTVSKHACPKKYCSSETLSEDNEQNAPASGTNNSARLEISDRATEMTKKLSWSDHKEQRKTEDKTDEDFEKNAIFSNAPMVKRISCMEILSDALLKNFLFATVPEKRRKACILLLEPRTIALGERVISQGDKGDEFFVVVRGGFELLVTRNGETKPSRVAFIGPGGSFGELALLYDRPRSGTVVATTESIVYVLNRSRYRSAVLLGEAKDRHELVQFLRKLDLFSVVNQSVLDKIANQIRIIHYQAGDSIEREGNSVDTLNIVKAGSVRINFPENSDGYCTINAGGIWGFGDQHNVIETERIWKQLTTTLAYEQTNGSSRSSKTLKLRKNPCVAAFAGDRGATELRVPLSLVAQLLRPLQDQLSLKGILSKVEVFKNLSSTELDSLCEAFKIRRFFPGYNIVTEGARTSTFFVVISGNVDILQSTGKRLDGNLLEEVKVGVCIPGQCFGERSVITGLPRNATCRAKDEVVCMELSQANFQRVMPPNVIQTLHNRRYLVDLNSNQKLHYSDLHVYTMIGTGTFSNVYLARNRKTNFEYAVKRIDKSAAVDFEMQSHIRNERSLLAEIEHPFITRLYAAFKKKNTLSLVLEFNQGGELFSLMKRMDTFPETNAKFYAASIVLALEYMHKRKIAHRDLKPENITLNHNGYVKLIDFGYAKIITDRSYTFCGTLEYIAPEILQGFGHSHYVDLWSLGVLIFEMLAGFTPFSDGTTSDVQICHNVLSSSLNKIWNQEFSGLVSSLLISNLFNRHSPASRWKLSGSTNLKSHAWFASVDFDALERQEVQPPFKPELSGALDISMFQRKSSGKHSFNKLLNRPASSSSVTANKDDDSIWDDWEEASDNESLTTNCSLGTNSAPSPTSKSSSSESAELNSVRHGRVRRRRSSTIAKRRNKREFNIIQTLASRRQRRATWAVGIPPSTNREFH